MRGYKSPRRIFAEMEMRRTSHNGSFLIVEGKDDMRFWEARRHAACELVRGESKNNVVGAVQHIDAARFAGAFGIVDDDGDILTDARVASDNLAYTDAHDLECLLCRSSALDRVLVEHGDARKIRRFEQAEGSDVRTALLKRGLIFGRLRLATRRVQPTSRPPITVERFVDEDTWAVDEEGLIRHGVPDSVREDVLASSSELAQLPVSDRWYVAQGHDLVTILRTGLRRVLGDLPTRTKPVDIARSLRLAMTMGDLHATGLYSDMSRWQAANQPYLLLRSDGAE